MLMHMLGWISRYMYTCMHMHVFLFKKGVCEYDIATLCRVERWEIEVMTDMARGHLHFFKRQGSAFRHLMHSHFLLRARQRQDNVTDIAHGCAAAGVTSGDEGLSSACGTSWLTTCGVGAKFKAQAMAMLQNFWALLQQGLGPPTPPAAAGTAPAATTPPGSVATTPPGSVAKASPPPWRTPSEKLCGAKGSLIVQKLAARVSQRIKWLCSPAAIALQLQLFQENHGLCPC